MRGSGWITKGMASGNRSGLMNQGMKDTGLMIKLTVLGNYSMQTEIFTRVNGEMIKQMVEELTLMPMEQSIQEIGKTISNMASE